MIPQPYIDEVLARANIVDVIAGYVAIKKTGKDWSACCPFHDEKSPSFTVSEQKSMFYCFGCGASGNSVGFIMDYEGLGFPDAILKLGRSIGIPDPDQHENREEIKTWQTFRRLKKALLDARVMIDICEHHIRNGGVLCDSDSLAYSDAQKAKRSAERELVNYRDMQEAQDRAKLEQVRSDEELEIAAYYCGFRDPHKRPVVPVDQKRALLALQRIKVIDKKIGCGYRRVF